MNEGLEALKHLEDRANHDEYLFREDTNREKAIVFLKDNKNYVSIIEKALIEHEQCENVRKEWKCDIVKVNEMLRHGYWVKYGTNEKGFTYKHYVPDNENVICLRHLGYDVEICCITSKNEWNAPITGFNEISLSYYGTKLALTKEELE